MANGHLNPNALDWHYHKTLQGALCLTKGYTTIGSIRRHQNNNNKEGVAVVQKYFSGRKCFSCGKQGRRLNKCPKLTEAEKENVWSWPECKGAKAVKETRLKKERKSREESSIRGVNHISTDTATGAEAPVSSISGEVSYQDYVERWFRWYWPS